MNLWNVPMNDVEHYYGIICDHHAPPASTNPPPDGIHLVRNVKSGRAVCFQVLNGRTIGRIAMYEPGFMPILSVDVSP